MELTTLSASSDPETSTLLSSSSDVSRKYDVFLNFRGEDTRKNIMGHLRVALSGKGIETFVDDDRLEGGHLISPQLLQAIESSSCAIVLLSPNYAFSTWCLDELVKILDCMKTRGQIVIPIFYHVEPSDVRKQTGKFGEAMAQHEMHLKENLGRVNNWRVALTELTNLAGFDLKNYRDEAHFVREIVEEASLKLTSMASSEVVQDNEHVETRYPLLGGLLRSRVTFIIVKVIVFYLIIVPLFFIFFFKVLVPIFQYFVGFDDFDNDTMPPTFKKGGW